MKRYIFLGAMAASFLGGLVTGKSAFGAEAANAGSLHDSVSEQKCLADNIYFEARNQIHRGMIAVSLVTRNRVLDSRFPHSYCEVVKQGPERPSWKQNGTMVPLRHRCQFSWYCDGKADEVINTENNIQWKVANSIAYEVLAFDRWNGIVEGANHYHADYVQPDWRKRMQLVARIDDHIFYRME